MPPPAPPPPPAEPPPRKLPRPHRCNDRVEDFLQACFTLEFSTKISPAWTTLHACLRSEPGQEPTTPHVVIKDPSLYLDPLKMLSKRRMD